MQNLHKSSEKKKETISCYVGKCVFVWRLEHWVFRRGGHSGWTRVPIFSCTRDGEARPRYPSTRSQGRGCPSHPRGDRAHSGGSLPSASSWPRSRSDKPFFETPTAVWRPKGRSEVGRVPGPRWCGSRTRSWPGRSRSWRGRCVCWPARVLRRGRRRGHRRGTGCTCFQRWWQWGGKAWSWPRRWTCFESWRPSRCLGRSRSWSGRQLVAKRPKKLKKTLQLSSKLESRKIFHANFNYWVHLK